ncbi:MAG: cytochrome P450 [Deltaproteobacteria bacterium]
MRDQALSREHPNIIHPGWYAEYGYPHDTWTRMRREDPVSYWDETEGTPFWAVTKHADIVEVGGQPELFKSGQRIVLQHDGEPEEFGFPPTLIQLDPPKHGRYRQLVNRRFTPGVLKKMRDDIERIGAEIVDGLVKDSDTDECDFVEKVAAPLPIAVIAWLMGVPREDWHLLFDWTNRAIAATDPDFRTEGMTAQESSQAAMAELFAYFAELVEDKKKNPGEDLVTLFANAEIDGEKLPDLDVLAWCMVIVIAGNETTRNATSGGMLAFIEHPDQLRRLQADLSLMPSAVEEVLRWTSPIIHFSRTATADTELGGKKIRQGERLALFYPSANRDEDLFDEPFEFRIDRTPNRHLAFGGGEHFCLGAHIARLELQVAYRHLLPRIEEIELAGPVVRLQSNLVGGLKRLPIRYSLKP